MLHFSCEGWSSGPVGVADSFWRRWRGLRPRSGGRRLWIPDTRSVHTFGMREPLVLVALTGDLVVAAVRRTRPGCLVWQKEARSWLELPGTEPGPPPGSRLVMGSGSGPIVG